MACTNYGAYTQAAWATPLFWLGLMVMLLPAVYRLTAAEATRRERIGAIVLLMMGLYLVKLLHSPFTLTFADEFVHVYNAEATVASNYLFNPNSILRVTAYYPGLAAATAALADVTGLPVMAAAVVLIGAARLLLVLAIFLLFEQVSGSTRVASLGVVLFMGQPSFLYLECTVLVRITFISAGHCGAVPGRQKRDGATQEQFLALYRAGAACDCRHNNHPSSLVLCAGNAAAGMEPARAHAAARGWPAGWSAPLGLSGAAYPIWAA